MKQMKILSLLLAACLLAAVLAAPAHAAGGSLDDFAERYGPLLADGLDALTDWLDGQTSELAPELRETLKDVDAEDLLSDLKDLVGDTKDLDDAALRARIEQVAAQHGIHLVDSQIEQMMELCRALEKLDSSELRERTDALGELLEEAAPGGLKGVWNSIVSAVSDAADWVARQWMNLFG